MPTIFEKIESALIASTVDVQINVQVADFGTVELSFKDFLNNGKSEIEAFVEGLNDVPLPESAHAQDLENSFQALLATLPEDISGISVGITDQTEDIIDYVETSILGPLGAFFELYRCIDELLLQFQRVPLATGGGGPGQPSGPFSSVDLVLSPGLKSSLEELGEAFDDLSAPLDGVQGLLVISAVVFSFLPREYIDTGQIPYLDEVQQVIETLVEWSDLTETEIGNKLYDHLVSINSFFEDCFATMDSIIVNIETAASDLDTLYNSNDPNQDLQDVSTELQTLAGAIDSQDTALITTTLGVLYTKTDSLTNKLQTISDDFFNGNTDDQLANNLETLLQQLEEKMLIIFDKLKPDQELDFSYSLPDLPPADELALVLEDVLEAVRKSLNGLCRLIEKLNLDTVLSAIQGATGLLNDKVNDWQQLVTDLGGEIESQLAQFAIDVDSLDTGIIKTEVEAALDSFQKNIQSEIDLIIEKIKSTIEEFITLIENTAGQYTYEDLQESLNHFVQLISEILMEYAEKLEQVKKKVEKVVEELETYSFKTVSDLVVELMNKVTDDLESIDREELNDALLVALTAALIVIPSEEELKEEMDKLLERFDGLTEAGPVALLERIKDKPGELLDKIKEHSPVPLIKARLNEIYEEIIDFLGDFEPEEILQPVRDKLVEVDDHVANVANPCHWLDAIIDVHEDLLEAYDRLEPDKVIDFLQEKKDQICTILDQNIPEEEIDSVIQRLEALADAPQELSNLIDKVCTLLDNYTTSEDDLTDWVTTYLKDKIDQIPNISVLDDYLNNDIKTDTIEHFQVDKIQVEVKANIANIVAIIQILDPQNQLNNLLQNYQLVKDSNIQGLPEPYRTEVLQFLAAFDPYDPVISGNLESFYDLQVQLSGYVDKLENWDDIFFGPNSPIYTCLPNTPNIKQVLKDVIDIELVKPLNQLFAYVKPINDLLVGVKVEVSNFITCLPDISLLRQAFEDIKLSLNGIQSSVCDFNLNPIRLQTQEVYETGREKLTDLDLQGIRDSLCLAFEDLRVSLKLSELLTEEQIDTLDRSYENLIAVAEQFDPVQWGEESLEPEFERLLGPYLEYFDLTDIFYELLDRLEQLRQELKEEMEQRIFPEFIEMLHAVPSLGSPAVVNINI